MNKLLTILLAGFFAAGMAAAQTSGSGSGALSGSVSGSTSSNTNNNAAISANVNTNTNTNTNSVNVYGPGSNKLARQAPAGSNNVSMLPGKGNQPSTGSTTNKPSSGALQTAQNGGGKSCPPGLAKKDNGCMPPGLAKRDRDDTRTMGNTGSQEPHRIERHRRHHG